MSNDLKKRMAAQAGFTLVEIMVVVVILGLLATAGTIAVQARMLAAKNGLATTGCATLEKAIESYVVVAEEVDPEEILERLLEKKYVKDAEDLLDPWGERYYVTRDDDGNYRVFSKGADKSQDTEDDISRLGVVAESDAGSDF